MHAIRGGRLLVPSSSLILSLGCLFIYLDVSKVRAMKPLTHLRVLLPWFRCKYCRSPDNIGVDSHSYMMQLTKGHQLHNSSLRFINDYYFPLKFRLLIYGRTGDEVNMMGVSLDPRHTSDLITILHVYCYTGQELGVKHALHLVPR